MKIYCCGCKKNVSADLVVHNHKFFIECSNCLQSVGTHKIKGNDYAPLGPIPTKKIRKFQKDLTKEIDFILELKKDVSDAKQKLFAWLSKKLFLPYRTEAIISKEEVERVLGHLAFLKKELQK